ncbi:MAG: class I SAM-dependent methyltransferase [Candidatus Lokiarchaeota archaeon]|nr:class I SAM-dependent methyltransferase [Candidatus Lokiarchaeota archaeon]
MNFEGNKAYWDSRYSNEGKIWGETPSKSAFYALKLFKKYEIRKILIPGSGYGRHTKLFSENGYKTVGIEISGKAIEIAKNFDPQTTFINRSVMDMDSIEDTYDAIYCYNVLHLFLAEDRHLFLRKCYNILKKNALVFFTVFSEEESSFGKGKELEKHTFESKPWRPTHYFSKDDLIKHFKDFAILETDIIKEPEDHGENGPHTHILRYLFGQKLV